MISELKHQLVSMSVSVKYENDDDVYINTGKGKVLDSAKQTKP